MLSVVDWAFAENAPVIEFMLHSSEFMPGGSPTFRTVEQIEILYAHLGKLFAHLASRRARRDPLGSFQRPGPRLSRGDQPRGPPGADRNDTSPAIFSEEALTTGFGPVTLRPACAFS